jgi:hypothetical protein
MFGLLGLPSEFIETPPETSWRGSRVIRAMARPMSAADRRMPPANTPRPRARSALHGEIRDVRSHSREAFRYFPQRWESPPDDSLKLQSAPDSQNWAGRA